MRFFGLLWIACFSLLIGCSRQGQAIDDETADVQLSMQVEPEQAVVGENRLIFTLRDGDGVGIDGATLFVKGDMTHAGMTPLLLDAVPQGNGIYHSTIEWSMAGNWIITVTGSLPDERVLLRTFPVEVDSNDDAP